MGLTAVRGGWLNTELVNTVEKMMLVQERKSKYKHKITMTNSTPKQDDEIREWCTKNFGPAGRKERWRHGWVEKDVTFYFRNSSDVTIFLLRWS